MDTVCRGLDFIFIYLDDILVASSNELEHRSHLNTLFECLQEHGLVVNPGKCEFGVTSIHFLGTELMLKGSNPCPRR